MEKFRTKRIEMELARYVEQPNILNKVDYAKHLKAWMDAMPEGHVRCWAFEDFMSRKEAVMKEIAEYVGVDPSFYDGFDFEHRNESVAIKSGALHQLGLKLQPLIPHALQRALLPLYMKLNSGGRVQDAPEDAAILATFKKDWSHVGQALQVLDPNFPADLWA